MAGRGQDELSRSMEVLGDPITRRRFLIAAGGVAGMAIFGACAPSSTSAPSPIPTATSSGNSPSPGTSPSASGAIKKGGHLRASFAGDAVGLDPALVTAALSHWIIEQAYSNLVSIDSDLNTIPDLAETWEVSDDHLTYTFHLRKGVTFHNGQELTSSDVQFTLDRLRDPKTGYFWKNNLTPIDRIATPDKYTVRIDMSKVSAPFLIQLAFPGVAIVSKDLVIKQGDVNKALMGTGPFKQGDYNPGKSLTFVKNENYFETDHPYVDSLDIQFIGLDPAANTAAMLSNTIDFAQGIDQDAVKGVQGISQQVLPSHGWNWITLNTKRAPFDQQLVRQAVSYAIDRSALLATVLNGHGTLRQSGPLPSWSWAYTDDKFYPATSDFDKAKALMKQAGVTGSKGILVSNAGTAVLDKPGTIIKDNLAQIGIDVTIEAVEIGQWVQRSFVTHDFDISLGGYGSPLIDPDDFYENYRTSEIFGSQFSNSQLDNLIDQARNTWDQAERKKIYTQLEQMANTFEPIVNTICRDQTPTYWDYVKGFKAHPAERLRQLKDVWLDK
jgi:peptide/nickel transport system substrate-binding protein